jgi:hypothetical protein
MALTKGKMFVILMMKDKTNPNEGEYILHTNRLVERKELLYEFFNGDSTAIQGNHL